MGGLRRWAVLGIAVVSLGLLATPAMAGESTEYGSTSVPTTVQPTASVQAETAGTTAAADPASTLPVTGGDLFALVAIALALFGGGALLVVSTRRARTTG